MLNNLSEKQGRVWLLTAMAVPLLQAASGCSWLTVLAVGLICFAVCWGMDVLWADRYAPAWILWLHRGWMALLTVTVLDWLSYCWPDGNFGQVVPLIVLLLAAWTVSKGQDCTVTVSGVLRFFLIALFGVVMLSGTKEIRVQNLRPVWQMPNAYLVTVMLIPTVLRSRATVMQSMKDKVRLLAFSVVAAVITTGALSLQEVYGMDAPFYELSRSASFLDVAKRFESLTAAAMTVGYYLTLTLFVSIGGGVSGEKEGKQKTLCAFSLIVAVFYLSRWRLDSRYLAIGSIFLWVLLPTLLIIKNNYKK